MKDSWLTGLAGWLSRWNSAAQFVHFIQWDCK